MSTPLIVQAAQTTRVGKAGFAVGIAIVGVIALAAIFGNALVPQDPFAQELGNRLKPPFWMEGSQPEHPLGTDQLGRDYLSRLLSGARISLLIGISVVTISGLIGTAMGLAAGYLGWESIAKNDFPVVQAVVLVLAVFYIGLTLLADILNALLDPRLRTG